MPNSLVSQLRAWSLAVLLAFASLAPVVAQAGGAVYPAKDARMKGEHFRQYFERWEAFLPFIDPNFSSSFWRRVTEQACKKS